MVHTAISSPCSRGTGCPATKYATHSNGTEDEGGGWVRNPEAALEKLLKGRVTWPGAGGVVLLAVPGASNKSYWGILLME